MLFKTDEMTAQLETLLCPTDYHRNIFRARLPLRSPSKESSRRCSQYIFSPVHYEQNYAYPLIVWLHGSGADENQLFRVMPEISMRNYVAVAPRGLTRRESQTCRTLRSVQTAGKTRSFASLYDWPDTEEAIQESSERVFDAIQRASTRYHVNPSRIFLAGFDVGGTMALQIASRFPASFAGAISLCGPFPEKHLPLRNWESLRQFPILIMSGTQSRLFSAQKMNEQLRLFHSAGMLVSIRQYNAAQELTHQMLRDVDQWIIGKIAS
ncbi:MAG: dienelactone hydrolase family protein [Planctomycetia bacterium]|nr:dienelactone hydrolase family protein [Planctomycetia bacterium]